MACSDDIGEMVEEMDRIQDCGVSSFDDDGYDKGLLEDLKDWVENDHKAQHEAQSQRTLEHAYTDPESNPNLHDAERFTPSATHAKDQTRNSTISPFLVAVGNLSDNSIRRTDPFGSTISTFSPPQFTNSEPHQASPEEQDKDLFNMPRPSQRSNEDTQDFQLEDDTTYEFPHQSVFQSTEEEEDFREQLEMVTSPKLFGPNEEPFLLQQESYIQPKTTRQRVISQPPVTSMAGQSESRNQDQSQMHQSLGQTLIPTQNVQHGINPLRPNFLAPSRRPHDTQQTPRIESRPQSVISCTWPQIYQGTDQGNNLQPPTFPRISSTRVPPQTMASPTTHTNDPTVQALLANAPGIDLSEPRLTNRCRGMEYVPFRTAEETKRIHNDHVQKMEGLIIRLRAAIARRLGGTEDDSAVFYSNVAIVQNFLYVNTIRILRIQFSKPEVFADQGTQNCESTQLTTLYRLLQYIDRNIRPKGPAHMENSLKAWEVAALKWQREIHEDWITELDTGKKRQGLDDNDDEENDGEDGSVKRPRKDESTRADEKPSRKPGRPPGSLNKSTIRAKVRKEVKAKEERRKLKTSLPAPSQDEVRSAKANAAKYASRGESGPGSAMLTSPRMTAGVLNPAYAQACTPARFYGQGQYQPQPHQNPFRLGYPQQISSHPFTNPFNPAPPQRLVHYQPYPQSQRHPQQHPQNFFPDPSQPPFQLRQHPSFLVPGAPPPAQRLIYPDPTQLTSQRDYPFSHQVPPRPSTSTTPTLGTANRASTGYTHSSTRTQQPGNSNNVDGDDGDGDDGGFSFTH